MALWQNTPLQMSWQFTKIQLKGLSCATATTVLGMSSMCRSACHHIQNLTRKTCGFSNEDSETSKSQASANQDSEQTQHAEKGAACLFCKPGSSENSETYVEEEEPPPKY